MIQCLAQKVMTYILQWRFENVVDIYYVVAMLYQWHRQQLLRRQRRAHQRQKSRVR